nr:beta-N-acetylhexosaminidase [uncultured Lachnoanaerobaculum sp.]
MKISCKNAVEREKQLKTGTEILIKEWNKDAEKLEIFVEFQEEDELFVKRSGNKIHIVCKEPAHYYRALTQIFCNGEVYENKEKVFFEKNGVMLDCSRNAVFRVDKVKFIIRMLAKLGLNVLMLYTEDTYEVVEEPYFGIYRGRYTKDEIQEIDSYAYIFGIELVPCIQTLAHLHNALKWQGMENIKDTADILHVGKEETYVFIEKLLCCVKEAFSTRRVHLGMDEAVSLGLGNYLKNKGYEKSSVLIKKHCQRVMDICKKLDLSPMIWSDMYITANTGKGYYDIEDNLDCSGWEKPEKEVGLVYWDYYHKDTKIYEKMIGVHKQISDNVIFAGGSWAWNGMAPNHSKTLECTISALQSCKENKLKEVFCTVWLDNGAETPIDAALPGIALFAYLGFHQSYNSEEFAAEFKNCTEGYLEDFFVLDKFDSLFLDGKSNQAADNPSKYLLYQDPLTGIFDYHIKESGIDAKKYYSDLKIKIGECAARCDKYSKLFLYYEKLAEVLSGKADLGVRLKDLYEVQDLSAIRKICENEIPNTIESLKKMKILREELWMYDAKPWGYELMDIKLGGVITRLESTKRRVFSYVNGELSSLEELENERLPYFGEKSAKRENRWNRIISGCDLVDTI